MRKGVAKNKGAQGCMKISSFFSKQSERKKPVASQKVIKKSTGNLAELREIINLDSEEEELPTLLSLEPKQTGGQKKRKFDKDNKTNLSPPLKKTAYTDMGNNKDISKISPQPSTSGLTPNNSSNSIDVSESIYVAPSTSGETPVKNKPILNIKSIEKLLNSAALKEFNSPEKVTERFLDKVEEETIPVKSNFQDQIYSLNTANLKQNITPDKNDNNTFSTQFENITPKLRITTPTKNSGKKSSGEKSTNNTPNKQKRTPKKLFERSPNNLNEFNVEVLRNFVKITPSKKEVDHHEVVEQNFNRKFLEVQLQNEKTPVKGIIPSTSHFSPFSKARAKLDFSECGASGILSTNVDRKTSHSNKDHLDKEFLPEQKLHKENDDSTKERSLRSVTSPRSEKENIDLSNLDLNFGDDRWDTDFCVETEYTLDLTESHHCKLVNVNHRTTEIILTVKSTRTNQQAICALQGFWIHSLLCIGDTVHIKATQLKDNSWLVDNQNGFMVFEPDFLLSVTSVVGSVFCKRKAVLQEKFRGFEGTNKFMIVGLMVHILLQEVLKNKIYNCEDIERSAREILTRKEWIRQIYESSESLATIEHEFMIYVPKIHDFIGTYVQNGVKKINPKPRKKDDWKGVISTIDDIEENIWCPDLGVKGKVDVSIKHGLETIPLEVKTGRASISIQHRGQVLLYIMMMSKLGYRVSSGLLLYLKDGILKELSPTSSEKRDIMILRNELAYYMTRKPKVVSNSENTYLEAAEVPEPVDNPFCVKCSYNSICMAYSVHTNEDMSTRTSLQQVHRQLSTFLTSAHIDYFMHWASLLDVEMPQKKEQRDLRDIYTLSPNERKNRGKCLINLKITYVSEECNGTFLHTFEENLNQATNFLLSGFAENTYIVVSVDNRPAISTGFVTDISAKSITVTLDKNLNKKYLNRIFFLDSYDSTTFLTFNLSSLALILDPTERSNQLRSIIIDRQPTSFQPKLPRVLADKAKPILRRLNRVQQRAVLKAIAANEYFLIKGMPGTGKTATIVALIQLLLELNKSVLITSHTHSAVDNVCLKLIQFGVKFMRLGSEAKMDANLREYSEQNLTKGCTTPGELEKVYNEAQVLAVTCLGSGHPILSKRTLDICIVDESTQVLQCSMFRALHAAKTFILLGDPDQLPAVIKSNNARELGMSESLFERLNSEESRITLNLNYRMNEPITGLANALTYNGELLIGSERIATATLKIPKLQELTIAYKNQTWLLKALDPTLENAVQFIDTGPVWSINRKVPWARIESYEENLNENQKCVNVFEAAVIFHLVQALINKGGVMPTQLGVICTYRAQVAQLVDLLQSTNVDVNTVDQFQGKDKSIIIYSCSKSKDLTKKQGTNKYDLLEDKRRLNVAITRAKHKLIIVGDFATLHNYSTFRKIQDYLEKNVIRLTQFDNFSWDNILDLKV